MNHHSCVWIWLCMHGESIYYQKLINSTKIYTYSFGSYSYAYIVVTNKQVLKFLPLFIRFHELCSTTGVDPWIKYITFNVTMHCIGGHVYGRIYKLTFWRDKLVILLMKSIMMIMLYYYVHGILNGISS